MPKYSRLSQAEDTLLSQRGWSVAKSRSAAYKCIPTPVDSPFHHICTYHKGGELTIKRVPKSKVFKTPPRHYAADIETANEFLLDIAQFIH